MARIQESSEINILKIKEFLGLNENPDGDTNLKTGELSEMRNGFRRIRCRTSAANFYILTGSKDHVNNFFIFFKNFHFNKKIELPLTTTAR